jgi:hypothetical protein
VRPVPIGAARAAAAQLGRTITAGEIEGAEKTPYERAAFKVIVSICTHSAGVIEALESGCLGDSL